MFPDLLTVSADGSVPIEPSVMPILRDAYREWDGTYTGMESKIFKGAMGYDYFISYNGLVNNGGFLETCDEYPCDWYPKMQYDAGNISIIKKYAAFFFPFYGTFQSHLRDFPMENIATSINKICEKTGCTPVFIGAEWDKAGTLNPDIQTLLNLVPGHVALIGNTTLGEVFGLMKGATLVGGYFTGLTGTAAMLKSKTITLWDNRFHPNMMWSVVPPDVRGTSYVALGTRGLTVEYFVDTAVALVAGG